MAELGNLADRMELACTRCSPPWIMSDREMKMEAAGLHFAVEHDQAEVQLTLGCVCPCGAWMDVTDRRPTGGGTKAYWRCPACGNTGHVVSREPTDG
jgi:hypothetical protein